MSDFSPGTTIYKTFATRANGAGSALTGGAVSVYKSGSLTQSVAGVTLTANYDGVTGFNHVAIDTSADGTFYSAGGQFEIVLTAGTVNGQSAAGLPIDSFTLGQLAAADDAVLAQVALVKAKTDSLTFTTAGQVDANVQGVNDVNLQGLGTVGSPWRPA